MTTIQSPRSISKRCAHGAVVALAALGLAACSDEPADGSELIVEDVWARPTPAGADNGAVYMTIFSSSGDELESVDVGTNVAAEAQMHAITEEMPDSGQDGVDEDGMDMADMVGMEQLDSVEILEGGAVSFQPGALHIMLVDLAEPLADGDRFRLTLEFRDAGERDVEVVVIDGDNAP